MTSTLPSILARVRNAEAARTQAAAASPAARERRAVPRRRTLKGAFITFNGSHSDFPCTLRDFSDAGARLIVQDGFNVPARFELLVEIDGMQADCEIVRREMNEIGVSFLAKPRYGEPLRRQVIRPTVPAEKPSLRRKAIAA